MISVVIPYLHSEVVWNELIFTVRSIDKNLKCDHRITLIGDAHPSLNIPNINAYRVKKKEFAKAWDSIIKMYAIINDPGISEDFLYWYDDIVLLREIDLSFFDKNYSLHDMSRVTRNEHNHYSILKFHTYDVLKRLKLPTYCYETHTPKLFNKQKMKSLLDKYTLNDKRLLINTMYLNSYSKEIPIELRPDDNIKAGFYGYENVYSLGNKTNYSQALQHKTFLNYDNKGLTEGLKKYIISRFPNKCRYETKSN